MSTATGAGEWGEAVDLLLAVLVRTHATVSPSERDELAAVVAAMDLETTESVDDLVVGE